MVIQACQNWQKSPPAGGWEIIVVDDASTDNSVSFLKVNFPQIKVVVHQKNKRFAAACNSGVKAAKGKIVVLLNNDVSPEVDFLNPLVKHFADPLVFAVGCKEKDVKEGKIVLSGRGLGEFRRGFLVHWRAEDQNKTDTLWATAGSMAVDKEKWLKFGGMDTLFRPAYWEDIDLSWRAKKTGWKILFEPRSIVVHQHETTNILAFGKKQMKVFAYKNQFLFVWKNGNLDMLIQHLFWLPYHLVKATLSGDWLFWKGFFQALRQIPELI
jgi:GT2 family glycosyltransferase